MMKYLLESLYQPIFNHWVRKNGYSSITPTLASLCSTATLLIVILDVMFLTNIFAGDIIRFDVNRGILWLSMVLATFLNHVLYFQILKIPKTGKASSLLFEIDEQKAGQILKFVAINIVILVAVTGISIFVSYARS